MEDREIIELFCNRDEAAIGQTAEKYGARLRRVSFGITEDELTAEECENDTYMKAWNTIPPENPVNYLFAYLVRIIRNLSLDACRRSGRLKRNATVMELTVEMEECIPAPDDTASRLEAEELGKAVSRYLRTLDVEKQIILMRRFWYLDSVESIADRLGFWKSKVKMTLKRCRDGLKKYLLKEGYLL